MTSSTNHGLVDGKEYQLKIGSSFQPSRATESYHLMRYDFKPASVDTTRAAEVEIGVNKECTVTIPNVHDAGTTMYKGGRRPCQKDCILIIDKVTGEITLERVSSNISLKKSRTDRSSDNNAAKRAEIKSNSTAVPSKIKPSEKANTKHINSNASTTPNNSSSSSHNTTSHNAVYSHSTTPQSSSSHIAPQSSSSLHASQNFTSYNNAVTNGSKSSNTPIQQQLFENGKIASKGISTSASDSYSSSSDSSDSDSGTENNPELMDTFTTKAYEPPPPPISTQSTAKISPTNTSSGMFMSTLHHDLHLSDSNESDSD